eukprot:gene4382-7757_t
MGQSSLTKNDVEETKIVSNNNLEEKFENAADIVMKKLQNSDYKTKIQNIRDLEKYAHNLSNVEAIKDTYLSLDWAESLIIYQDVSPTTEDSEEIKEMVLQTKLNPNFNLKKELKLKLLISEVATNQTTKDLRELFSPFLASLNVSPELGLFHSALMIGPWILEWNSSSLCIPRKCVSSMALISADLEAITTTKQIEETVDIIAKHVVKWNCSKIYEAREKKENGKNCQSFVEDLLKELGVEKNFGSSIDIFLKQLKNEGKAELKFTPDSKFLNKFKIEGKSITFHSHQQLDKVMKEFISIDIDFKSHHPEEYSLLKSFDRAFWLRYFKFPNSYQFQYLRKTEQEMNECEDDDDCDCYFGDPNGTGSVIQKIK